MMNNVHEDAPEVFESRWTMSYLRGPLTRNQIQTVMAGRRAAPSAVPAQSAAKPADTAARPVLPAGIAQYFIPVRGALRDSVTYRPMLLGVAQAHFIDAKTGVDEKRDVIAVTPVSSEAVAVNWDDARELDIGPDDLEKEPVANAGEPGALQQCRTARGYMDLSLMSRTGGCCAAVVRVIALDNSASRFSFVRHQAELLEQLELVVVDVVGDDLPVANA